LPRSAVERAGHQEVVQYRGRILPVVRLAALFSVPGGDGAAGPMPMVVCGEPGRQVGLLVERILDVIEAQPALQSSTRGDGTLGSTVLAGHVTDLLDVPRLIQSAYPASATFAGS